MSKNLSEYLPRIRRIIQDIGDTEHEEFLGDDSAEEFYLTATPIKTGSVTVYLDDIETTLWSVDYDTGQLLFGTAPAADVVIKVLYTSYLYSDTELIEYLESAIDESMTLVEDVFTITGISPYSYIDATPENAILKLWFLLLQRNIALDRASITARNAISWRTEDMAVNRTQMVRDFLQIVDKLDKQIEKQAWRINYNDISGVVVAGGEVPSDGYTVGESYVIEWGEYPRRSY